MWKEVLNSIIESCAYMDPMAYMYYLEAKRETRLQTEAKREQAGDDTALIRLVERLRVRQEAKA
jgi:hypothetical protein